MNYRIEQLRYQLREDPSSRVFYQLAELLRREGEAEEAAAILRRGLEGHPRYAAAWVALGRALGDLQDSDGAGEAFTRAHQLDAGNVVAARAVAEVALADKRWADAADILRVLREAAPDDKEVAAGLADAEEGLAEEEAAAEALATQKIPIVRSPAEVISISGDDPFADEGGASDDGAIGIQDVFAVEDRPETEIEPAAAETSDEISVGEVDDDEPATVDDDAAEAVTDRVFGADVAGEDGVEGEEPEFESWADVGDDDEDTGRELRVEPPPEVDLDVLDDEEAPAEEAVTATDEEEDLPTPEIAEPDLDPIAATPAEPDFESWADVDDDDNDDDAVQPTAGDDEAIISEPEPDPAADLADMAEMTEVVEVAEGAEGAEEAEETEEIVIPEAIAHFDRGLEDEDDADNESEPVTASDVPLPTLTLAKLALEQGDEGLAVATLERLIEQNPSDTEASEMLHGLRSGRGEDSIDVTGAKVAALRGWLDTIRLASERQ